LLGVPDLETRMKTIVCARYGPPEVLELREAPMPVPGAHQVLVRIHASTVGVTAISFRKGEPLAARLFGGLVRPRQPNAGDVLSGEIVEVGAAVGRFRPGDAVFGFAGLGMGANTEYLCVSEREAIVTKPPTISHVDAAAIVDGGLTALPFLRDGARLASGQRILVNGASGSVGTAAVQLARYLGAHVTGVCSTDNLALVRSLGADAVVDYTREDFTRSGQTYDVVFDVVARSSFGRCRPVLSPAGVYLTTFPSPSAMLRMLLTRRSRGRRTVFMATGLRKAADKVRDLELIRSLMEQGKLRAVVGRTFPLAATAEAHRYVEAGRKQGVTVLTMDRT
jgi:NADPH:quinone reductase-like Zn-dependent oxidoreductase